MGSFADSIKRNTETIKKEVAAKSYAIVFDLFNGVVKDTPVDSGLLINNWFTMPDGSFSTATSPIMDKSGSGSYMNINSLVESNLFYGRDSAVTMSNNLDYAYQAENIGWARTPPYRMVFTNLIRVGGIYQ